MAIQEILAAIRDLEASSSSPGEGEGGGTTPPTISTHQVAASGTVVDLRPANASRAGALIVNTADRIMYVNFGDAVPSATSYALAFPAAEGGIGVSYSVESSFVQARIRAVWAAGATGQAVITEAVNG